MWYDYVWECGDCGELYTPSCETPEENVCPCGSANVHVKVDDR